MNVILHIYYKTHCDHSCNDGKCVNNNVCNCAGTFHKGLYCDEYYQYKRIKYFDLSVKIISCLIVLLALLLMIAVYLFRHNPRIKAASIDFMFIILVGVLFYSVFLFCISNDKKTKNNCFIAHLSYNIGFSLIFGSILVKTYRIYKIFNCRKGTVVGINKNLMYLTVLIITMVHILISLCWMLTKRIDSVLSYTNDLKEYSKCVFPSSKNISVVFNFIILFIGSKFTYSTRNVKKNFKEDLFFPVFTYVIFAVLMEIVNLEKDLPTMTQDLFNVMGTVINTIITIYYLFVEKFSDMYFLAAESKRNINSSDQKKLIII